MPRPNRPVPVGSARHAQRAKAKISADDLVDAHTTVMMATMADVNADLVEQLLDALELKAREDMDLTFPGSFNIRAFLKSGDRPSWVPVHYMYSAGKAMERLRDCEGRVHKRYDGCSGEEDRPTK